MSDDFLEEMISLVDIPHHEPSTLFRLRLKAKNAILTCTDCTLHEDCIRPVPATFASIQYTLFTVIGEAPGPDEDRQGKPFIGRSGRKLRELFDKVGFDPRKVSWANTVCCFPNDNGKIKPPPSFAKEACRQHLEDQLTASGSRYVLLVGSEALHSWRPDFNISDVHGKVGFWNDTYCVMPVYHPSYVLRNQGMEHTLIEDLATWKMVVNQEMAAIDWISATCWICGDHVEVYDRDGVAYCGRHWEKYKDHWLRARER